MHELLACGEAGGVHVNYIGRVLAPVALFWVGDESVLHGLVSLRFQFNDSVCFVMIFDAQLVLTVYVEVREIVFSAVVHTEKTSAKVSVWKYTRAGVVFSYSQE